MSYDSEWASHKSGPPALDPRGPHHGDPDPEFVMLCADAERQGMIVSLHVAGGKPLGSSGREYRKFTRLTVGKLNQPAPVTVWLTKSESLRSAATRARERLGAA